MSKDKFMYVPVGNDKHLVNVGNIIKAYEYAGGKMQIVHFVSSNMDNIYTQTDLTADEFYHKLIALGCQVE